MENLEVAKRENAVIFLEKDYKQTYQGYDPNSAESNIMFEFIQDKNMENSVELAKYMQRYVCQATGRKDLGAQQDNLAVLRLSSMPGCLVECGFISTRDEEQFMNSKGAEEKYARGLFNAFLAYRKKHGGNITIPFKPEPAKKKVEIPQIVPQDQVKVVPSKKVPVRDERVNTDQNKQDDVVPAPEPVVQPVTVEGQEDQRHPSQDEVPVNGDSVSGQMAAEPVAQEVTPVSPVASPVVAQAPVFKVQFMTSSGKIRHGDRRFKGLTSVDSYQEGGLYKYTVGSSENYNQIYRLRKEILDKFPGAFIIAFKNGSKMDVNEAIREFKANKGKK